VASSPSVCLGEKADRCADPVSDIETFIRPQVDALRRATAGESRTHVAVIADLFCDDRFCRPTRNGAQAFADNNHLNIPGALGLASDLRCAFVVLLGRKEPSVAALPVLETPPKPR